MPRRPWRLYAARAPFASHHLLVLSSLKNPIPAPPENLTSVHYFSPINSAVEPVNKSGGRLESGSVEDSVSINATYERSSPMKREAYRAVDVKQVMIESLVTDRAGIAVIVGVDVAKSDFLATVRWSDGRFERPWRAKSPDDISDLVGRFQGLADGRSLTIA